MAIIMAIASREREEEEPPVDPIETHDAEPREPSLTRDISKSLNGVFRKSEEEQSENQPENEDSDLPQRGQGQRKFHLNSAPRRASKYILINHGVLWKPGYLLVIGILVALISMVAGQDARDKPEDPLISPTLKRTIRQGAPYRVTELPEGSHFRLINILIGDNTECSINSFATSNVCTVYSDNQTACGLTIDRSAGRDQLFYSKVDSTFQYCIYQHTENNFTLLSGTVFITPNKTSDPSSNDDYGYKYGFWVVLALLILVPVLAVLAWCIYKNRQKNNDAAVSSVSFVPIATWNRKMNRRENEGV